MPSKPHEVWKDAARHSIGKAVSNGTAKVLTWHKRKLGIAPHSWRASYAGNCSSPVLVERTGRPLLALGKSVHTVTAMDPETHMTFVEYEVPCRKCDNCLRRRAAHWRLRARAECNAALGRTWFGSLTLSPEQHHNVLSACRLVASRNGDDFDLFPTERQFAERHKCISREITLYVKRLRKQSEAELRFLCVAEAHKNGLPHYHMLVHEAGQLPIRHHVLSEQWRVGFSHWKLADVRSASYVTKYLAKSMMARVRASIDYGNPTSVIGPQRVREQTLTPSATSHALPTGTDLTGKELTVGLSP